ncbi:MAG: 4Fe-4S dicluster domain-containing protein, partial [Proteobacteria bacterium]|nr:4Fe-4S dicluster domain-containing protein [Pseudomonadota bacterium]
MARPVALSGIEGAIAPHGLAVRGGFVPEPGDGVPACADGRPAAGVVLVGNVGPAMWRAFEAAEPHAGPDPLNAWSDRVITKAAADLGASALLPFTGPPYLPFQRWAQKADAVHPSPLGILIHPDYGLWHAYRGAFAFAESIDFGPRDARPSPCDSCADKPCLSACPVNAFDSRGFDVQACLGPVTAPLGEGCRDGGCL